MLPTGWAMKNIFHPNSPKTALLQNFFNLFILLKNLYQTTFMKKDCIKELCKKSFENILN